MGTVKQLVGLVVWILICEGAGGIGALSTTSQIPGWYAGLHKPSWTPPNAAFGPVWTFLYLTTGVAAWLVWRKGGAGATPALVVFAVQLAVNVAWSYVFFGRHLIGLAFADIILLWLAILATILLFWRQSALAGALLLPYLAWVTYGTTLNWGLWRMNRG